MRDFSHRRDFLKTSSLIALAPSVPSFLRDSVADEASSSNERVLVVIQLGGGNDGINTVVPYADEGYAKHRKELRLPESDLVKLDDAIGLHRSLRGISELMEEGRFSIVQGVGYPNPSRSHDVSMSIWQTARMDPALHSSFGWLGRGMDDVQRAPNGAAHAMLIGDETTPKALLGRKSIATTMSKLDEMQLQSNAGMAALRRQNVAGNDLEAFVTRSMLDAYTTSDLIETISQDTTTSANYPNSRLAQRLQTIAGLVKADLGTKVYYAIQPGYDTHSNQLTTHSRLLSELSNSLQAFQNDLATSGLDDRVLTLCFSEFGRRVDENGSKGTDHGTAGPIFLSGPSVKPGMIGQTPSLTDLVDDDLAMQCDFRRVYASLLEDWLGLPSRVALGGEFEKLSLLKETT